MVRQPNYYLPFVITSQDYYPFGMLQPGRLFSSKNYRFGFNDKEKTDELYGTGNAYDYGMRMYDSRLGRFLSTDPLFKKYPELTPYQFAGDMPIVADDLDGEEPAIKTDAQIAVAYITKPIAPAVQQKETDKALDALTNDAYEKLGGDAIFSSKSSLFPSVKDVKSTIRSTIEKNVNVNVSETKTQNFDGTTSTQTTTIVSPNNFSENQEKNAQKVEFKNKAFEIAKGTISLVADIPDPSKPDDVGEDVVFALRILEIISKPVAAVAGAVLKPLKTGDSSTNGSHAGILKSVSDQTGGYLNKLFKPDSSDTKTQNAKVSQQKSTN